MLGRLDMASYAKQWPNLPQACAHLRMFLKSWHSNDAFLLVALFASTERLHTQAIRLEDRPGTLGKLCQALAEQSVNILAFQSCPLEKGKSAVRLVLDNPAVAKSILDRQKTDYTETEVAKVTLTHRPGELARAVTRLGIPGINIDSGYCALNPNTNPTTPLLRVANASKPF